MGQISEWANAMEAARILQISRSQVNRRAAAGELPVVAKAPGVRGAYFFDRDALGALAEGAAGNETAAAS